jgi:MFS transporter, DHA2 family, methylenomycin A resistance protein
MSVATTRARATRGALPAASVALAAVLFDATAVPVLLPLVRVDLGSSSSGVQWAQNAHLLALAASLPLLARLAAWAGGQAVAAWGALLLVAGAVVCALAETTAALVGGRAVAGAGAAAVLAATVRLPRPTGRGALRAIAIVPALALLLGPLVGGLFGEQNWWRIFFWAGVPLAALTAAPALLARPAEPRRPLGDLTVPLAFAAVSTALAIGLVQSEPWGWGWPGLVALLAAAAALGLALHWSRALPTGALTWFALGASLAAISFLLPEYLELARRLSPLRSGVVLSVATTSAAAAWTVARWLTARLGGRAVVLAGLACAATGLATLSTLDAHTPWALIVLALTLAGTGLGLAAGALCRVESADSAPPPLVTALTGAALGLAAAGAVFQHAEADDRAGGASFEQALASGVGLAALLLLALAVCAAPDAWRLGRRR